MCRDEVTADTAVEVFSVARRKWKQLRVRGAAADSFTGPLTPVCWAEGRGVALLGGLNIRAATAELNPDLELLEVKVPGGMLEYIWYTWYTWDTWYM